MTKMEFSGPGLSSDQWERINDLAVSLQPAQALWLSGYFAGVGSAARGAGGFDQEPSVERARCQAETRVKPPRVTRQRWHRLKAC